MASDVEMDSINVSENNGAIAITSSQGNGASKISIPVLVHSPSPTPSNVAKDIVTVTPPEVVAKPNSKPASVAGSSSAPHPV
jgi:hypothetical protein